MLSPLDKNHRCIDCAQNLTKKEAEGHPSDHVVLNLEDTHSIMMEKEAYNEGRLDL